ncbi:hypothetical protein FKZ61_022820 [Litorilinea aerophila]|uniref:hypothetical protein n=1 Tax=Litorilinea aerophila TaxID=1204385 RepID=UPI001476EDB8|nr:hypothetical protein [Litorilinea aerophila]MCC9078931.1 hypothetical protein [Litorilinea aerophila]
MDEQTRTGSGCEVGQVLHENGQTIVAGQIVGHPAGIVNLTAISFVRLKWAFDD